MSRTFAEYSSEEKVQVLEQARYAAGQSRTRLIDDVEQLRFEVDMLRAAIGAEPSKTVKRIVRRFNKYNRQNKQHTKGEL